MTWWHDAVAWLAAFVAVWWLADWLSMRQEGEPLPLRRAPLRVLGDVVRKLARNPSFVLALVALWMLSAAIGAMQIYFYRLHQPLPAPRPETAAVGPPAEAVPRLLTQELPEALPRLEAVPLGVWGGILLAVLLLIALVRLMIDPPEEIGASVARGLRWPAAMLGVLIGGMIALMVAGQPFLDRMSGSGPRSVAFTIASLVIGPALLAPVVALLWRLAFEVVELGSWSFVSSVRALSRTWLPVALALIMSKALLPPAIFGQPGRHGSVPGIGYMLIGVLLVFVPWALVDLQAGLIDALRESWRLFRARWFEVIAFALRFTLLFAVLGGLVALIEPPALVRWQVWYGPLLSVVRNALVLLQVMTIAGLYVHLRDEYAVEGACAICPVISVDAPDDDNDQAGQEDGPS